MDRNNEYEAMQNTILEYSKALAVLKEKLFASNGYN